MGRTPGLAIVLAGGDALPRRLPRALPPADLVVAADGGLAHAEPLGLTVDLVVGDLDSATPDALARAEAAGAAVEAHPRDKDATDLALALDAVLERASDGARVIVVGGHGGRLDHLLGNVGLLAADRYAPLAPTALVGPALVSIARGRRELTGRPGELVTLLAVGGTARGVTTEGLAFPLTAAELAAGSSLGVSNRFTTARARLTVADGVVVVVQPEPDPEDPWP